MLIDKRLLVGGAAMLAVGITLSAAFNAAMPTWQTGMTEDEELEYLMAQQEIEDYSILSGILMAVGFLLVLVSMGARRKKRGAKNRKNPAGMDGDPPPSPPK